MCRTTIPSGWSVSPSAPPLPPHLSLLNIFTHTNRCTETPTHLQAEVHARVYSRARARALARSNTPMQECTLARMNASVCLLHTDARATTQTHGHMRMHRDRIWRHRAGNDAHYQRPYRLLGPMEGAFPSMRVLVAYEVMQQRCSCMHTCVRPHAWGG